MSGVVFVDCETTGLDPDRHEIWELAFEVAAQVCFPVLRAALVQLIVDDEEHVWTVGVDLSKAHPQSTRVGLTANRQLVGTGWMRASSARSTPPSTPRSLTRFLSTKGYVPAWHYHVIDVKAVAAGWLMGRHPKVPGMNPPWSTDDLARGLHLSPEGFDRHTALGDARLAKAMYEAVMAP